MSLWEAGEAETRQTELPKSTAYRGGSFPVTWRHPSAAPRLAEICATPTRTALAAVQRRASLHLVLSDSGRLGGCFEVTARQPAFSERSTIAPATTAEPAPTAIQTALLAARFIESTYLFA